MAISNKVDKSKYGPSMFEIGLGATLSVVLGAALATGILVAKPARAVKQLPKEEQREAGVIYYLEGAKDYRRSQQWRQKKQQLIESRSITVSEDEINAWLTSGASPAAPSPAKPGEEASDVNGAPLIGVGTPNFRIRDDTLQVSVQCSFNIGLLGIKHPLTLLATGRFEKNGDTFAFVPDKYFFGSCAGHRLWGLGGILLKFFTSQLKVSEDIVPAWKKLAGVAVEGSALKLTMP